MATLDDVSLVCDRDSNADDWMNRIACWVCRLRYADKKIDVQVMLPYEVGCPNVTTVLASLFAEAEAARGVSLETWYEMLGERTKEVRRSHERSVALDKSLSYLLGSGRDEVATLVRGGSEQVGDESTFLVSPEDYRYDGMSLNQLMELCHQEGLTALRRLRWYRGNREELREAARDLNMASSTARTAWSSLKLDLKARRAAEAAKSEKTAVRCHNVFVREQAAYRRAIAD